MNINETERSWLIAAGSLALGEALAFSPWWIGRLWTVAAIVAVLIALFSIARGFPFGKFFAVFLAAVALASSVVERRRVVLDSALELSRGKPYVAVFRLERDSEVVRHRDGSRRARFAGEISGVRVRVNIPVPPRVRAPRAGEAWECAGWLERKKGDDFGSSRGFYVGGSGTYARRLSRDAASAVPAPVGRGGAICRLRESFLRRLELALPDDERSAGMLAALVLGEKRRLSSRDRRAFADAGTAHVFAISGLHVMIVAMMIAYLARILGCSSRMTALFVIPMTWLYVAVTGFAASSLRAATMASFYFAAPLVWRRPNGLVAWVIAFMIIHVVSPLSLMDVGSRFSFAVMLALILWGRWRNSEKKISKLKDLAQVSLVAWAAGVPIAAATFGTVSLSGIIANIFLVPLAEFAAAGGVMAVVAGYLSHALSFYLASFAALVLRVMAGVSYLFSALPGASVSAVGWSALESCAWYSTIPAAMWLFRRMRRGSLI